ncbi:uncharacterized protein LOC120079334 [Benincasa hispida]|uniref:uncharacterized protein LOC120079334 n=1 Tax=Benincasa hispida TaxID=102211 RepID=UPI00190068FE|nr:uncharacterized protein LOC120079334 [Benincasa hispida]
MISVMNKDFEFEKKPDGLKESHADERVLNHAADSSNHDEKVSGSGVVNEVRVSLMELDPGAPGSEFDAKMLGNGRSAEFRVFPSEEVRFLVSSDSEGGGGPGMNMKFSNSLVDVKISKTDRFDGSVVHLDAQNDRKANLSQYKSLMSEFDDYVANESSGAMVAAATSRAMSYGFEVGDMVWGKVKSHPWWPGHIFNDALASPSVRRTRREGYVLVAFFGDSSYGWFDPAELIPFEPNYYEKSRQTTSRTFLKAVEEAVDEASRRRGLGLACKCRNRYNFRQTNVDGYFAVDVPDFEAGGIYSWNQIRRSRDSFKPGETLSFIKQLALTPRGGDHRSINFLNNKATVFAYRRSVYEEFDETYAQAFGVPSGPGRPPRNSVASLDQHRQPARAPLSGPLVIAEALGGGKSAIKPMKLKDQSKKDRYLLKRRDEPSNLKDFGANQEQATSTVPLSIVAESAETGGAGDYVLLKRTATILPKSEHAGFVGTDVETSSLSLPSNETEIGQTSVGNNLVSQGHSMSTEVSSDKEIIPPEEPKETIAPNEVVSSRSDVSPDMVANERDSPRLLVDSEPVFDQADALGDPPCDQADAGTQNISKSSETPQQPELSNRVYLEGDRESDKNLDSHVDLEPASAGVKSDGDSSVGGVMKPKVLKRPAEDMSTSDIAFMGEKRKKKKKRDVDAEMGSDQVQKQLAKKKARSLVGKVVEKSDPVGLSSREDFRLEHQKKSNVSTNNSTLHAGIVFGRGSDEFDVPQLLNDLQAFALDPFYGVERNCHVGVQKFFLRFRSLVYQKSLGSSPPSEAESTELRAAKSADTSFGTDNLSENVRDSMSLNSVKPLRRRDDPTKTGRKRVPSDRLEEIASKKLKKMGDLKLLASERKATQKLADGQKRESRDSVVPTTVKMVKRDSVKKLEPPSVRKVDPTMLVMKFPPETSLPSLNELKARFGRFGPIDQSGLRIFWKSSTCRVVFLYKPDAQAAYKYAMGNKSLFGNVNVKYQLREVGAPATEAPESEKVSAAADDNPAEAPRTKDPTVLPGRASTLVVHQPPLPPLPAVQLKSCLKKSTGDESGVPSVGTGGGSGSSSSKGTTRVKFMLGGEESNRNNINANFADGGTSSVAMDINSNFFQKVVSTPPLPIPPQFTKPSHSITTTNIMHQQHSEMPQPRNTLNHHHHTPTVAPLPPPPLPPQPTATTTTDISQQLLSLLTRCSDVVTNVTGLLGYAPYHPL